VACLEWPARVRQPIRTSVVCAQMDMYPTVLEAAGVKLPDPPVIDGISLLPLFDGKMAERPQPLGFMLWPKAGGGGFAAIDFVKDTQGILIEGKYKLMVHPSGFKDRKGVAYGKRELYNLKDDLAESKDVLAEHPEVAERLGKLMRHYIDDGRSTPGEPQRPEVEIRLP
jgi:arylsulfatase A-like enzyme